MSATVLDFHAACRAARARLDAQVALREALGPQVVEHSLEIDARRIPVLPALRPTLLEQIRADLGADGACECIRAVLEESLP